MHISYILLFAEYIIIIHRLITRAVDATLYFLHVRRPYYTSFSTYITTRRLIARRKISATLSLYTKSTIDYYSLKTV